MNDNSLENIQKILLQAYKNTLDRIYIPSVFKDIIEVRNGKIEKIKEKTLIDVWEEEILEANKNKKNVIVFEFNSHLYISSWQKDKWSNPYKI